MKMNVLAQTVPQQAPVGISAGLYRFTLADIFGNIVETNDTADPMTQFQFVQPATPYTVGCARLDTTGSTLAQISEPVTTPSVPVGEDYAAPVAFSISYEF